MLGEECRKNNQNEKNVGKYIGALCEKGLIENIETVLKYEIFNNGYIYEILINRM